MNILRISKQDRKWYEIILWWEVRRFPFNVIMYLVGLASFYVGYVTIPLLYILMGLALNAGYTVCWIIELAIIRSVTGPTKMKYPRIAFFSYLMISTAIVFGFAFFLIL